MMIIDFTPARRERSRTISKSSGVSLEFRESSESISVGIHTIVSLLSMMVPAEHRVSEVHCSASSISREQILRNGTDREVTPDVDEPQVSECRFCGCSRNNGDRHPTFKPQVSQATNGRLHVIEVD